MDAPPPPILRSRRTYRPPSSSQHQPRAGRARPRLRTRRAFPWRSVLYQISFGLFLVLIAAMLVGSAWSLGEQAWRTGGQRKWNIVFLAGTYLALVSDSKGQGRGESRGMAGAGVNARAA